MRRNTIIRQVAHRAWHCAQSLLLFGVAVLAGCAGTTMPAATTHEGGPKQVPVKVLKPEGDGPYPAIVIMHDCSGLGPRSSGAPMRWAQTLLQNGYAVAIPDSFSTRGFPGGVCTDASPARTDVAPSRRVADAYAALAYLRTLPYIDGSRVGIMGGSHGGSTTLASMVAGAPAVQDKRQGFRAAVALYPACAPRYGNWQPARQAGSPPAFSTHSGVYEPVAPLLILIGESDDWTPAEPCRRLAETARQQGHPVSIRIYPGAHHAFDNNVPVRYVATRINANAPGGRGATTGGNAAAWTDSTREVMAFFGQHLRM
jgi:dienelactone hydrolase